MTKKIVIVVLALILCLGLVACKKDKDSQYTVTFYANDGKTVVTTMEVSDQRITPPEAPKIEGYTFVGWYLDSPSSSLKIDAEFFMRNNASKDRNAYAKYVKDYCKLSFYSDGYLLKTIDIADEVISLPEAPEKNHYNFQYWYMIDANGDEVVLTEDYFVNNNAEDDYEAHAKFERVKYTLTFMYNGEPYECGFKTGTYEIELDKDGNPVLDKDGNPKYKLDENGNKIEILEYKSTIEVSDGVIELPVVVPAAPNNSIFDGWYLPNYTVAINENSFVGNSNAATKNLTVEAKYKSAFVVTPTSSNTCTIDNYIGTDKDVVIPETVDIQIGNATKKYTITAISANAFAGKAIESIVIGDKITSIGNNAFKGCESLKTVTMNATKMDAGKTIFAGVKTITEIKATVEVVNQIENKWDLVKVTFTAGKNIPANMFNILDKEFEKLDKDNKKIVAKLQTLVLPAELETIGAKAFNGCVSVKAIHIPASVKDIALDAFINCSGLATITVDVANTTYTSGNNANCIVKIDNFPIKSEPDEEGKQTVIGTETVKTLIVGCANTKIYEGVNEIAKYAFVGCTGLTKLSIPASVEKIAEDAFIGSTNITSITVAKENTCYTAVGNCLIALSKDAEGKANNRLVLGCKNSVIDRDNKDITSISKYAFANTAIESICIPVGVTELEDGSFYGCINLKKFVIINPELKFTDKVFDNYRTFTHIEIPATWLDYFRAVEDTYEIKCPNSNCNVTIRYTKGAGFDINKFICPECDEQISAQVIQSKEKQVEIKGKNLVIQSIILTTGTEIAEGYFAEWYNLTEVTLCDSITTIGREAFYKCTKLTKITLSENSKLSSIGISAFENCSAFTGIVYVDAEGKLLYNNKTGIFVVPATITKIDNYAFKNTAIKNLEFANDCKTQVGTQAFAKCGKLVSAVIPSEAEFDMSFDAFEGCTKIATITSPAKFINAFADTVNAVTTLTITSGEINSDDNCYYIRKMSNLLTLTIGKDVTKIDNKAFEGCSKLASITVITVDNSDSKYYSLGNCIIETKTGTLILGCTTSQIPDNVYTISSYAFAHSDITSIKIPAHVKKIEIYAFSGCRNLENITIENKDIEIEDNAFVGCNHVTSITVPASAIKYIHQVALKTVVITSGTIESGAFKNCSTLTNVTILPGVKVENGAFEGCKNITTLTAPVSVLDKIPAIAEKTLEDGEIVPTNNVVTLIINAIDAEITKELMSTYKNLKYLTIASDIEEALDKVEDGAFAKTIVEASIPAWAIVKMPVSLTKLTITAGVVNEGANLPELKTLIFAEGVTEIGEGAFKAYTSLTSVTFTSITTIGKDAFSGCTGLTSVTLPYVTVIGDGAFSGCTKLNKVTAPVVTTIGNDAFSGCVELTGTLNLPKVETIGDRAFSGCKKITGVSLPSVTTIGEGAFVGCALAGKLNLPEVKEIGKNAFSGCVELTGVNLPKVEKIGDGAFSGCEKLADELDLPVAQEIGENAFSGCVALTGVNLPSVTKISENAFAGCEAIVTANVSAAAVYAMPASVTTLTVTSGKIDKAVVLPILETLVIENGVTNIADKAFDACEKLVTVSVSAKFVYKMPASVTTVTVTSGKFDLDEAKPLENLTTLEFAEGVTEIGKNAFAGCEKLESVTLPASLTVIGENAFSGCVALASIDLSKVTKIGASAFEKCTKITKLDLSSLTDMGKNVFDVSNRDLVLDEAIIPSLSFVKLQLPYSVKKLVVLGGEIGEGSLWLYNAYLETLVIGADVTSIDANAIKDPNGTDTLNIANVEVDENNENYKFEDGKLINIKTDAIVWDFTTV